MISYQVRVEQQQERTLQRRLDRGLFRSLGNAAAAIRNTARSLIVRSKTPSAPGEAIHSATGQAAWSNAVLYAVDERAGDAVVGFNAAVMGESMSGHEKGERYMGTDFPERPTMGPALEINLVRFADEFEGSIGE